jgi:cbb3-type cytochrome oxidase subunit 3
MKFTNYLKDIQNVSIYPVFSLILFTAVFLGVIIYTFSADKKKMNDSANIPLN